MAISSMTGYARAAGAHDGIHWQWEVKSVNGKALDVRSRLPAGFEALEPGIRSAAMQWLKRGNLQVGLTAGGAGRPEVQAVEEGGDGRCKHGRVGFRSGSSLNCDNNIPEGWDNDGGTG